MAKGVLTTQWLNPEDPITAYRNNPLIGALGPIMTRKEREILLTKRPPYKESERMLPSHLRPHVAFALRRLFIPTPTHAAVVQELELLIRQGYVHRNPLDLRYRRVVASDRLLLENGSLPPARFPESIQLGTAATGAAGTGKTMSFDLGLMAYPQLIEHCYERNGSRVAFKQVTALKLNMFQDASLKAFGVEFFDRLDEVTGETLRLDWGIDRCNRNNVQCLIYQATREFNLGMLVVDELQNISALGESFGAVLRYFIRMMNCVGVPVGVIGTNTARTLMQSDLAASRRFIGNIPAFNPMRPGPMWDQFLAELWKYQYTRVSTRLGELSGLVYELTGGIPDLAVKLYLLVQLRLFGKKSEVITADALRETAELLLYSVKDRIAELRGIKKESRGFSAAIAQSEEDFRRKLNREATRLGAAPVYPEVKGDSPIEIRGKEESREPRDKGLVGAATAAEIRSRLENLGQCGILK